MKYPRFYGISLILRDIPDFMGSSRFYGISQILWDIPDLMGSPVFLHVFSHVSLGIPSRFALKKYNFLGISCIFWSNLAHNYINIVFNFQLSVYILFNGLMVCVDLNVKIFFLAFLFEFLMCYSDVLPLMCYGSTFCLMIIDWNPTVLSCWEDFLSAHVLVLLPWIIGLCRRNWLTGFKLWVIWSFCFLF